MNVLIVTNAYAQNKSQIHQATRVKDEFENKGISATICKNINLTSIIGGYVNAVKYDACIFFDKDKSTARMLEKAGIKLFNSAKSIEICDDKMLTHIALANENVPMPDSINAPLCYTSNAQPSQEFLDNVATTLSFPLVAKKCYGSLGAGVTLINDYSELYEFESKNILTEHFYQKYINSGGSDVRVIVIGGKVLSAMKRTNKSDFRSNIELGGTGEKFDIDDDVKDLCEKVATLLNLDYCGIDVIFDEHGQFYICEVNSNAFFAGIEKYCDVNVAQAYVEYIINKL